MTDSHRGKHNPVIRWTKMNLTRHDLIRQMIKWILHTCCMAVSCGKGMSLKSASSSSLLDANGWPRCDQNRENQITVKEIKAYTAAALGMVSPLWIIYLRSRLLWHFFVWILFHSYHLNPYMSETPSETAIHRSKPFSGCSVTCVQLSSCCQKLNNTTWFISVCSEIIFLNHYY